VLLYVAIAVLIWLVWYLVRRHQGRVAAAFVLAPLLASAMYGPLGLLVVLPIALLVTAALATPLFFLFRRRGWLKWWQVGSAGLLSGLLFSVLFDWPTSDRFDAFGLQDALNFGGVGLLIAIAFWWIGVYRNSSLPAVPRSVPYAMLVLVPLAISGFLLYRSLYTSFAEGRIIAVSGQVPSRQVSVRLSDGSLIETSLLHDTRPTDVLMNQCWHLMNHWSTTRFERVYSLMSPFGGGVNKC
jgi:hypothetical protein